MKILSWNINSVRARITQLGDVIRRHDPDIILLQETKCEDCLFPQKEIEEFAFYNFAFKGQKSYNGVAILSKFMIDDIKYDFVGNPCSEQCRFIEIGCNTEIGYLRIISLYVPNGGEVRSEKFELKLHFFRSTTEYLRSINKMGEIVLCGGDLNVAAYDIDVYSPEKLRDGTCFTLEERKLIRKLFNNNYLDIFRLVNPNEQSFTWWDYRGNSFKRDHGMRIDYLLANPLLAQRVKECYIDLESRKLEKPSDHAPVIAVF